MQLLRPVTERLLHSWADSKVPVSRGKKCLTITFQCISQVFMSKTKTIQLKAQVQRGRFASQISQRSERVFAAFYFWLTLKPILSAIKASLLAGRAPSVRQWLQYDWQAHYSIPITILPNQSIHCALLEAEKAIFCMKKTLAATIPGRGVDEHRKIVTFNCISCTTGGISTHSD